MHQDMCGDNTSVWPYEVCSSVCLLLQCRLSDKLTELGEDVEALLADIADDPSDEET